MNDCPAYLSTPDAARLLGWPETRLRKQVADGVLRPDISGMGRIGHRWSLSTVLALVVSRGLRARGASVRSAGDVLHFLLQTPTERLEAAFEQGRTSLLIIGDGVACRLMNPDSIKDATLKNPAAPALILRGVFPYTLDVKKVWEAVRKAAKDLVAEKAGAK